MPSCAVTITRITLPPGSKLIAPEAVPLIAIWPSTFTVAVVSLTVGVTVILLVPLLTVAE